MAKRPNILLIFTDQQRHDTIQALGNPVIRTPQLDRFCAEGTAFTSAYSPSPVCVPARCSLMYGQYPARTGCYDNQYAMPTDRPSLMDALARAGYRTHGVGKCHFTPDSGALRGFQSRETQEECRGLGADDDYMRFLAREGWPEMSEPHGVRGEMYYVPQVSPLPARLHPTQWVGDQTSAFITDAAGRSEPWFLFASFVHPHPPFAPPAPWHKLYRAALMPLPQVPADAESLHLHINRFQNRYKYRDQGIDLNLLRVMKAHYYACISFIDFQLGRLRAALEQTGQLDDTLILFTSDHGEHLGDYDCFGKRSLHDSCARIPLLARLPGRFAAGARCVRPASLVDIFPTVLGASRAEAAEAELDGEDLAAVAAGQSSRRAVFSQFARGEEAVYTAVTERWKYGYSAADDQEYLFDRRGDPQETRNRAGVVFCRSELAEMRRLTQETLRAAGEAPALDGDGWRRYPVATMPRDPDAGLLIQDPPGMRLDLPGYTEG